MKLTLSIQKTRELISHEDEENNLVKKIESITKSLLAASLYQKHPVNTGICGLIETSCWRTYLERDRNSSYWIRICKNRA